MQHALRWLLAGLFSLTTAVQAMTAGSLSADDYQQIKQTGLDKPQLTHSDIAPLVQLHQHNPLFRFKQLGKSALGTPIWQIDIGTGPVKVLAWSQMHGDEATATAALMDLLNFISADQQQPWRDNWLNKVTLRLIPMVHPDGVAANTRFNSTGIYINRDATALQSAAGRLVMHAPKDFKPVFGLNLHD